MPTDRVRDGIYQMGDTFLGTTLKEKNLGVTIRADTTVSEQCDSVMLCDSNALIQITTL